MSAIFGFIFFIIIIILIIGLSIINGLLGFVSGFWSKKKPRSNASSNPYHGSNRTEPHPEPSKSKKVFDDDEGEYVDFEEIKDDAPGHTSAN